MPNSRLPVQIVRRLSFALLLLTICLLLGACGREEEDEFLFAPDSPPVTLTYVGPNTSFFNEPEQAAIDRFQELAPSIEVDRQNYGFNAGNYLMDSPPPDVMLMWDGNELRNAAALGLLSDLSEIWTEGNFTEAYGRRFRDISRFDGTLRFVPAGFNWSGIYYNREIFERYGLTPPATWEEFIRVCDTLLANGITPMSLAGQNPFISILWFDYLNLRLNGPDFHRDLMAGRVDFHDVRVARVWETWKSLLDRGYFVLSWEKAVMTLASNFSLADLPPVFADELDFFQFPQMDPNLPIGEVSIIFGYIIPADALNRAEAGAFIGFMGSAEAQELQLKGIGEDESNIGYAPAHREIDRDLLSAAAEKGDEIVTGADEIIPPLYFSLPDTMRASFNSVLRRLFLSTHPPMEVSEIQLLLEEGRQKTIQNGEFPN